MFSVSSAFFLLFAFVCDLFEVFVPILIGFFVVAICIFFIAFCAVPPLPDARARGGLSVPGRAGDLYASPPPKQGAPT